jgi:hypothetical protein
MHGSPNAGAVAGHAFDRERRPLIDVEPEPDHLGLFVASMDSHLRLQAALGTGEFSIRHFEYPPENDETVFPVPWFRAIDCKKLPSGSSDLVHSRSVFFYIQNEGNPPFGIRMNPIAFPTLPLFPLRTKRRQDRFETGKFAVKH